MALRSCLFHTRSNHSLFSVVRFFSLLICFPFELLVISEFLIGVKNSVVPGVGKDESVAEEMETREDLWRLTRRREFS
jgi:hypothetical protein